jgi:hypothetical protein
VTLIAQLLGESIGLGGVVVSLVSFAVVTYANRSGQEKERQQSEHPGRDRIFRGS